MALAGVGVFFDWMDAFLQGTGFLFSPFSWERMMHDA
jgi:hypothetical protein